jgi:hypothetical protein
MLQFHIELTGSKSKGRGTAITQAYLFPLKKKTGQNYIKED